MPNFLRLPFFHLRGGRGKGVRFCRQTQSEAINGVTHTPRKPRCQRPAAKCQGNKYQQSRAQTQPQTQPQTQTQSQTVSQIPTTPPCYSLRSTSSSASSTSSSCLRCLQQRAAQRRSLQVGVPVCECQCVCATRPTPLSDTWAAPARLLSFRA